MSERPFQVSFALRWVVSYCSMNVARWFRLPSEDARYSLINSAQEQDLWLAHFRSLSVELLDFDTAFLQIIGCYTRSPATLMDVARTMTLAYIVSPRSAIAGELYRNQINGAGNVSRVFCAAKISQDV